MRACLRSECRHAHAACYGDAEPGGRVHRHGPPQAAHAARAAGLRAAGTRTRTRTSGREGHRHAAASTRWRNPTTGGGGQARWGQAADCRGCLIMEDSCSGRRGFCRLVWWFVCLQHAVERPSWYCILFRCICARCAAAGLCHQVHASAGLTCAPMHVCMRSGWRQR